MSRGSPPPGFRRRLWRAQACRCHLCLEPLSGKRNSYDHVIPASRGGRRRNNLLLAHPSCNHRRGDRLLGDDDFEAARAILMAAEQIDR